MGRVPMRPVRNLAGRIWRQILPPRCLLCGAPGEGIDLCASCRNELPRNGTCCAFCALPLETPAPRCGACLRRAPRWDHAWSPFRYAWPLDRLESRYKFAGQLAAGRVLGTLWARQPLPVRPQLVIPVPLHRQRLRERGYNQALELARVLAREHDLPLRHDVLRRVLPTRQQTELDAVARRRNVRGAFQIACHDGVPRHVAVVDDVMTTGATLSECAHVLKRAGVQRVDVWTLARAP